MPEYRRAYVEGGSYFFAVITDNRLPILTADAARALLSSAWMDVRKRFTFTTIAVCLLPDYNPAELVHHRCTLRAAAAQARIDFMLQYIGLWANVTGMR